MVTLIVTLVILGLLFWLLTLLPLPDPFPTILKVVFILIAIYVVLGAFGILPAISGGHAVVLR